jgi:indolepyruvate ferredoxin oxidoreductase, alpha subunit
VLDNSTTAMTGHQPHPGIGKTMMGADSPKISIYNTLKGLGVPFLRRVDPFDQKSAIKAAKEAAEQPGVSAIIFEAPCIALFKPEKTFVVDTQKCKACKKCIGEIGCPALHLTADKKAEIDGSLCYGCGLCAGLCAFGAIGAIGAINAIGGGTAK